MRKALSKLSVNPPAAATRYGEGTPGKLRTAAYGVLRSIGQSAESTGSTTPVHAADGFAEFGNDDALVTRLDIAHLQGLVRGLCRPIEALSGLRFKYPPAVAVFETVAEFEQAAFNDGLARQGLPDAPKPKRIGDGLSLGVFLPSRDEVALSPAMVGCCLGFVKAVLAHEMTHALQFQMAPRFFTEIALLAGAWSNFRCRNDKQNMAAVDHRIAARTTWLEGHATHIEYLFDAPLHQACANGGNSFPVPKRDVRLKHAYRGAKSWLLNKTSKRAARLTSRYTCGEKMAHAVAALEAEGAGARSIAVELLQQPGSVDVWFSTHDAWLSDAHDDVAQRAEALRNALDKPHNALERILEIAGKAP